MTTKSSDAMFSAENDPADAAITLADARRLLPCDSGSMPTLYTVRRWTQKNGGVQGPAGNRVRLKVFRLGGRLYTRPSWIKEFITACTDGVVSTPRPSGGISEARRRLIARGVYGQEAKKQLLGLR